MIKLHIMLFVVFLVLLNFAADASTQNEDWKILAKKCINDRYSCLYFARHDGVKVYSLPDTSSETLFGEIPKTIGGNMYVNDFKSNKDWIRDFPILGGAEKPAIAWVRREDILPAFTFGHVSACWPVKRLRLDVGDDFEDVYMRKDGSIVIDDTKGGSVVGHIYMAEDIYFAKIEKKSFKADYSHVFGVFDRTENKIVDLWKVYTELDYFTPEEMKGCEAGPVTTGGWKPPTENMKVDR